MTTEQRSRHIPDSYSRHRPNPQDSRAPASIIPAEPRRNLAILYSIRPRAAADRRQVFVRLPSPEPPKSHLGFSNSVQSPSLLSHSLSPVRFVSPQRRGIMVAKSRRRLAKLALLLLALLLLLAANTLLCIFLLRPHHRKPLPPGSPPGNASNPDDSIVAFDFSPFLIMYKSGRVHRLDGTARCAAGVDEDTGVTSKDVVIDSGTGLAARMYLPPAPSGKKGKDLGGRLPVLVFYHGGAFVIESAFTPLYHAYLNAVAAKARVVAVSVEYRLAPEHRLPTAYNDSWQALNWVARNAASGPEPWLRDRGNLSRLFLAGDSAGANIAHNMAMRAGTEEVDGGAAITGLLLLDPYFWGKKPVAGETTDNSTRRQYEATWSFICGGRYGIDDPLVNPLSLPAAELRKLACSRVAVTSSGLDDFRPRDLAYAAALRDSGWGGEIEQYETDGERHVYFLDRPKDPNSVKELAFVTGFLSRDKADHDMAVGAIIDDELGEFGDLVAPPLSSVTREERYLHMDAFRGCIGQANQRETR
ncbi:hypothetical protein HU200_037765 [Digitaria exilis]|uniref:Alpha/beta hydrolase fold-3 domain-containing protein n=1 Tax=Digitaria exilis TaxID=1010633 RepID=A0A835BJS9_9POAL|nr:hypothetical protein HU200_037765 [Digitaria exilis]